LVGASGAGIAFAGEVGFWAGTMLWLWSDKLGGGFRGGGEIDWRRFFERRSHHDDAEVLRCCILGGIRCSAEGMMIRCMVIQERELVTFHH